jgi:succinate-semialdehyde dehydrogenase / glutarate-semialdehyde dehydrogenase
MSALRSINPATHKPVSTHPVFSAADTSAIIDAAHTAWLQWRDMELPARAAVLRRVAVRLGARTRHSGNGQDYQKRAR